MIAGCQSGVIMFEIGINGLGVVCALGNTLSELTNSLYHGYVGTKQCTYGDSTMQACIGEVTIDVEMTQHDRSFVLADNVLQQALKKNENRQTGLICASSLGGILSAENYLKANLNDKISKKSQLMDYPVSSLGKYLTKKNKLNGPVISFSTACTSSFIALGYALELMHNGEIDSILVCSVDTLCEQTVNGFSAIGASSNEPARPFDIHRKGLNLGEAAAAVFLQREKASNSINSIKITGYGISNDAFHLTAPHPEGKGLLHAIEMAMKDAHIKADEIDAVHTHGTGTKYNDLMELKVLEQIFSGCGKKIPVFSTKGLTGHSLGPSGLIALISACIVLDKQFIPGTNYYTKSEIDLKHISLEDKSRTINGMKNILIISSGFTGHNGALIVQKNG